MMGIKTDWKFLLRTQIMKDIGLSDLICFPSSR